MLLNALWLALRQIFRNPMRSLLTVLGIVIGLFGMIFVCAAYPVYHYIIKKEREKIAPEIIKLTDELMK